MVTISIICSIFVNNLIEGKKHVLMTKDLGQFPIQSAQISTACG